MSFLPDPEGYLTGLYGSSGTLKIKLSYPPSGPVKNSTGYATAFVPNIKNYHLRGSQRTEDRQEYWWIYFLSLTHTKLKSLGFIGKKE